MSTRLDNASSTAGMTLPPRCETTACARVGRECAGIGGPEDTRAPYAMPALSFDSVVAVAGDAGAPGQLRLRSLILAEERAPHRAQNRVLPSLRDQMVCERMVPPLVQGRLQRLASLRAALQHSQHVTTLPCLTIWWRVSLLTLVVV